VRVLEYPRNLSKRAEKIGGKTKKPEQTRVHLFRQGWVYFSIVKTDYRFRPRTVSSMESPV
jgi:hypothetical protein